MTNDQMIANRFGRWAKARKLVKYIQSNLEAGNVVVIATHTRAVQYKNVHVGMFKATRTGAYVQRGKHWDCIDYCAVKAFEV